MAWKGFSREVDCETARNGSINEPCVCTHPRKWALALLLGLVVLSAVLYGIWLLWAPRVVAPAFWLALVATAFWGAMVWFWYQRCTPVGLLSNDRNMVSQSRFQIVAWTLLVGTATLASLLLAIELSEAPDLDVGEEGLLQGGAVLGAGTLSAALLGLKKGTNLATKNTQRTTKKLASKYQTAYLRDLVHELPREDEDVDVAGILGLSSSESISTLSSQDERLMGVRKVQRMWQRAPKNLKPEEFAVLVHHLMDEADGNGDWKRVPAHLQAKLRRLPKFVGRLTPGEAKQLRAGLQAWVQKDLLDTSSGYLYANRRACEASLLDMFQGDQVGNTSRFDFGKFQFFVAMLVALGFYAASVIMDLWNGGAAPLDPSIPAPVTNISGASATLYVLSKVGNSV